LLTLAFEVMLYTLYTPVYATEKPIDWILFADNISLFLSVYIRELSIYFKGI